jgi:hypothetical protein
MSKEEDENISLWKGEASDELTSFFRSIFEYRLSVTQGGFIEQFWKRLMDDYIKDPSNGIAPNKVQRRHLQQFGTNLEPHVFLELYEAKWWRRACRRVGRGDHRQVGKLCRLQGSLCQVRRG